MRAARQNASPLVEPPPGPPPRLLALAGLAPLWLWAAPRTREQGLQSQVRGCLGVTRGLAERKPPSLAAFESRRVLDPIFRHLNSGGEWKQHGFFWKDYEVSSW